MNKKQPLLLILLIFMCSCSQHIFAKEFAVVATDDLQKIIDASQDGDTLTLSAGEYFGNFVITKQITLRGSSEGGEKGSIIDAQGNGHALVLKNSHITIDNLNIINWGHDLTEQSSGIYSNEKVGSNSDKKRAVGLVISNNTLSGDGFGIWLNHVTKAKIFNNKVEGNLTLRSADRGNGIQVANVTHSHVFNNETHKTRDGIYVISSQNNLIEENTMHHLRYGIHYMYSYDNTVKNNTAYSTRAGYALMSSRRLTITGNKTTDSEDYGFLLNFITQSTFTNNHVKNVWTKPENKVLGRDGKGLFVYNSGYNTLENNIVDTAEIGIHLTAGSENIKIHGNSFINNPTQVKYVSNKKQEWSKDGRGNYWSNYLGWDMNNDGIGDAIFEPNDGIDKLVWQYPEMKMIMDSPAILILRWVQKQFPVLKPPGVKDSYPLMTPHFSQDNASKKQVSLASNPKIESLQEDKL
ncbi:nitrous oxide reductase family maturation protein NosD [Candidatus Colwellia aromaticivorans]|uniref:nitrous oxide reductase family maturation protein NosD n=1 Tax=Candidatus Colwellia aromaticivorans TaxID=2267621 RepID=UPI000DF44B5B|nr:nitrous oxide reductase family maturation protein NosD [Candidatus Colwellia aromaticivorans]